MKYTSTILFCIFFIIGSAQNTAPIAVNDTATSEEGLPVTINMLNNDYDNQGQIDTVSVSIITNPSHGTVVVYPSDEITYVPDPDFVGTDYFGYRVCDTGIPVLCDTAIVYINVNPVTDTIPDSTCEGCPTVFCSETIFSGPITTTSVMNSTSSAPFTPSTTGCIQYTPISTGMDTFYLVTCSGLICDTSIFIVDISMQPQSIRGNINSSLSTPLQNSNVYLVEYDANIDSVWINSQTTTDANGFYIFYYAPQNSYIKAIPDLSLYPNEVPTYYSNASTFSSASSISNVSLPFTANFNTIAGVNPGGAGFISGYVSLGAGKKDGGEPIENLNLILKNINNEVVKHTTTNGLGYFEYDNLAIEEYSIWVDNYTVSNDSVPIVSLLENSLQENLSFTLDEDILILNKTTAITPNKNLNVSLYPNPTTGTINIENTVSNSLLEVYNILGNLVFTKAITTNNSLINLSDNGINKGTYIVKLKSDNDIYCTKVVLK